MEQVRSFVAIELPDSVKLVLTRLQDQLKSRWQSSAKWVNPYGVHLTLKFLGNINPGKIGEITRVIETAADGIPPFYLEIKGLGVFPNPKRVQVAWVGLGGEVERLTRLQQHLDAGLQPLGFATESRTFTPHLTLARLHEGASPDERQSFGQLIASTVFEEVHTFDVESIYLMRSQLTRTGAIYSPLSTVKLKGLLSTSNN